MGPRFRYIMRVRLDPIRGLIILETSIFQQVTTSPTPTSARRHPARRRWLGRVAYEEGLRLQKEAVAERLLGRVPDTLLLLEHPPTYTIGRGGGDAHLLVTEEEVRAAGGSVHRVDRGGDITYHGPGQLVGYPILDLEQHYRDVHRYLRDLEEALIRMLAGYGIEAGRIPGLSGVWVGREKIAALGVHVSRWVTSHGFALNVTTNLSDFDRIVPCGIHDHGVTSMERRLGRTVPLEEAAERMTDAFAQVFPLDFLPGPPDSAPGTDETEGGPRG